MQKCSTFCKSSFMQIVEHRKNGSSIKLFSNITLFDKVRRLKMFAERIFLFMCNYFPTMDKLLTQKTSNFR
jgi:hypothetical protein